jgi:hypothetical protein
VLEGKYDHLPEMAFYMVGDITEVEEKADKMAKEIAARKVCVLVCARAPPCLALAPCTPNTPHSPLPTRSLPACLPSLQAAGGEANSAAAAKEELKNIPTLEAMAADVKVEVFDDEDDTLDAGACVRGGGVTALSATSVHSSACLADCCAVLCALVQ